MSHPATFLHGARTPWQILPNAVRDWITERTGPPTDAPVNCIGGMATGAAVIVPGTRRTLFAKAVDAVDNPRGAEMYLAEAEAAASLPRHRSIPELVETGLVQDDSEVNWRINLFPARPGATPVHPWRADDLHLVLAEYASLRPVLAATAWTQSADLSKMLDGWERIAADPSDPWHPWAGEWSAREASMRAVVDGGAAAVLGHIDLRADNILIAPETGQVSFLDWAHPATAAPWADLALLLADVVMSGASVEAGGEIDVVELFARFEPDTDPELLIAAISSLAACLHARAHNEASRSGMPHRQRWSAAASQQVVPFIRAHSRGSRDPQ